MPKTSVQMLDELRRPTCPDYVAERHALLEDCIVVWAPCGCYYMANVGGSFVTACVRTDCTFAWPEVERALEALRQAEESIANPKEPLKDGPNLVSAGDSASNAVGTGQDATEIQAESNAMISEGGPVGDA